MKPSHLMKIAKVSPQENKISNRCESPHQVAPPIIITICSHKRIQSLQ